MIILLYSGIGKKKSQLWKKVFNFFENVLPFFFLEHPWIGCSLGQPFSTPRTRKHHHEFTTSEIKAVICA
jgi:hypothetical protein